MGEGTTCLFWDGTGCGKGNEGGEDETGKMHVDGRWGCGLMMMPYG